MSSYFLVITYRSEFPNIYATHIADYRPIQFSLEQKNSIRSAKHQLSFQNQLGLMGAQDPQMVISQAEFIINIT